MTLDGEPSPTRTIVVADDDPDLLLLMTLRLTNAGYDVVEASDGRQALDLIFEHLPQLALLDLMMPRLSGAEVLARLRATEVTKDMLVVLTSASFHSGSSGVPDLGVPARADDYISKPFGRGVLQARVAALFDR